MPRLDFYYDRQRIVTVKLRESSILIGRSSRCDIQLPADGVSREHARILMGPAGDHLVEDLSTNGTRVNAATLEGRSRLSAGDRIYIEEYTIIYQPDEAPPERLKHEQTIFMKRPPELE